MRSTTTKLTALLVAVLLANCGLPSDSGVESDESAASAGSDVDGASDGLTALRDTTKRVRLARRDATQEAIDYLTTAAESIGVSAAKFTVLQVTDNDAGDHLTHVRLQQTHDGVPVWGADSVVHLSADAVLGATGNIARQLAGTNVEATALTSETALARAKADRYGTRPVVTERETVEKVVYVDAAGTAHVALHTSFFNEIADGVQPAFWNHIYDANTGKLLARWNELHTVEQASGPGGNAKYVHSWNSELDVEPKGSDYVLTTARLKTLNMKQTTLSGSEEVGSLASIGDAPINDAHGFAEVTLNMLSEWMGRNSIDDRGFQILSRVHYSKNYENAFWDGKQMTYGDGASRFYPLSGGLDVCAHEIHHGFTTKHSNLVYSGESGGLNEAFSDIAGKTAEFFYKTEPNFDLGADVFKAPDKALRYMCDPPKDGKSIDHASKMKPSLDVHYSSGVMNKAFCLASKRMSSGDPAGTATRDGVKRTASAFFQANAQYWTSSTKFIAGCQGTLDAARALGFDAAEVENLKTSWADVGVVCN